MNINAIIAEAKELAAHHPSKDCRFFCEQLSVALPAMLAVIEAAQEAIDCYGVNKKEAVAMSELDDRLKEWEDA